MMPTASSMGRVTRLSISAGAAPAYRVSIVSVGYEMSGRRLTGRRVNDTAPKMATATTSMPTATGRRTESVARFMADPGPKRRTRMTEGGIGGYAPAFRTLTRAPSFRLPCPATMTDSPPDRPEATSIRPSLG